MAWLALLALCLLPAGLWAREARTGVGVATIEMVDPIRGGPMQGHVFYPAAIRPGETTRMGPYVVDATVGAKPLPGPKPLVLLSHGHAGSSLGHADLATWLAGHGFVVATMSHAGDDVRDSSLDGRPEVWGGRPVQVSATIDRLLRDPRWKPLIDPERIGVAGFSNGGYTALMLVGAEPRFTRFAEYCARHADDALCAGAGIYRAEAARQGQTLEQLLQGMQAQLNRWGPTSDPRIKAAFAMAPMSLVFDAEGLARIDRPVFLAYSERDDVLRPSENAARIRPLLKTLAGVRTVPKADHWVFIPPCTPELAKAAPQICADPAGVDRAAVHKQLDADALAFFRSALRSPAPTESDKPR